MAILALALLAAAVAVISAPLRAAARRAGSGAGPADGVPRDRGAAPGRDELEAAREAKYREIRDAELDFRTGKLSREDFETIDGELRAEAIAILDRLDALGEPTEPGEPEEPAAPRPDSPAG